MWKRVMVACLAILGTLYICTTYYNSKINATQNSYQAGGHISGRVNIPPSGIKNYQIGMKKGDKIMMGINNPYYTDEPLSFQLIRQETYNDYGCVVDVGSDPVYTDGYVNYTTTCNNPSVTAWLAGSTRIVDKMVLGQNPSYYVQFYPVPEKVSLAYIKEEGLYQSINSLYQSLTKKDKDHIKEYNLSHVRSDITMTGGIGSYMGNARIMRSILFSNHAELYQKIVPLISESEAHNGRGADILEADLRLDEHYYYGSSYAYHGTGDMWQGTISPNYVYGGPSDLGTKPAGIRPYLYYDTEDVIFAVSKGTDAGIANIEQPEVSEVYTALYQEGGEPMKLRVHQPLLDSTTGLIHIENINGDTITKTVKDHTIYLKATAQSGADSDGNPYTVSAIIFDRDGNFVYYQPLERAKGSGVYAFDLTGIANGTYKIGIVNEAYNENSTTPAECSMISDTLDLEVVEPHKIAYEKSPQSGATKGDYEYTKNVNAGQAVGKITVDPQGIMPLTYVVDTNGDSTYENFEIDGLDSNNASSQTSLNVKIKQNAPDLVSGGLKAGTYKFCISAQDDNGYPDTPSTSDQTKVCTAFTVEKTDLSIAFDDPNQTKKSVTDAATAWNETATASPSDGVKITYSKVGGDISLIDIDPDSGEITYKGNGSYGKVKIRATADDDPNTGNDNYNSAYVEKEIVVYAQVDGSVTPDPKSSDANEPTFTANDANVKTGGTIGTIKGEPGTPDDVSGSKITYTYGIKSDGNGSFFAVNSSTGVITTKANLGVDTYHITVTVSDKWSTKEIPVTINVGLAKAEDLKFYETKTSSTVIDKKTVNFTDKNVEVFATVKGSSNSNPVKYEIKDGSSNVIEINPTSGAVTIRGIGTVTIVATKKGASGQADARAELTFTVTEGAQNFIYTTDSTLSKEMPKNSSTGKYNTYEKTYEPNGTFNVYTTGNPSGTTVTYQLKAGSNSDVISVDSDGTVHILNASRSADIGHVTIEATSHDPSGNYSDKTIELPITIKKGTRKVEFADDPVYVVNGTGSVTPIIKVDGNPDTEGTAVIEVDVNQSSTAWTNNGKEIQYSYSGDNGKDIKLHVNLPGNRNYENAEGDGTLHILGINEAMLAVSTPGKIIYGDHFTVRSTQDDSASENVQYTFTVDNTTYISSGTINGKQAEFDALKYSGNTEITITVTRTADGEVPLSKKVKVKVLPKPVNITIEDKEKLKGEANPPFTTEDFTSQLVSWNGTKDVIQTNDIKLSTTANQNSQAGNYPIKGDVNYLNKTYPNYSFTMKEGTLTVTEENIDDSWYHMETDDGQSYRGDWTNQDVNIVSDHSEYVNMSKDQSSWNKNFVSVSQEGNNEQSFWMKKDSGAITGEKKERIKIDKKAPKVKNIKAKDSNNKLQDIINTLSGGIFFKPGTTFEITTDDSNNQLEVSGTTSIAYKVYKQESDKSYGSPMKQDTLTVSNEKANITISETAGTYKVCVIPTDKAGNEGSESCHEVALKKIDVDVDGDGKPDFKDPDGDGCPDLNIKWKGDDGKWVVINGDRNNDGIPDFNIDSDGDGEPDLNLDTDGDGKPDLNLVILKKSDWKPTICVNADEDKGIKEEYCTGTSVKVQINVDTDNDNIPNINIDTDGDMKANLNITKGTSQKPYLNILPITDWKPVKDHTCNKFTYDTMEWKMPLTNYDSDNDGKPDINIDFDYDGIPDLNIDSDYDGLPDLNIDGDGDGKPDFNIDKDEDGTPDENIIEITDWKPEINGKKDGTEFDTMNLVKNELEDNGIIVTKPDGTPFLPNYALKVEDVTEDKKEDITNDAKELLQDQEIKKVYDVKLLKDGVEVQPEGILKVKIPYENINNPILIKKNTNGTYEKIEYKIEDGYLIYETDELGIVSIIGDKESNTSVMGTYTPNIGGAITGDETNTNIYMGISLITLGILSYLLFKRNKQKDTFQ